MGIFYASLAAFGFAFSYLMTRKGMLNSNYKNNIWEINSLSLLSALLFYLIILLISGDDLSKELASINKSAIFLFLIDGLLGSFIGTVLGIVAIGQIGASHASAIRGGANPLFAILLALILLGERPGLHGYLGIALIIGGILFIGLKNHEGITSLLETKKMEGGVYALLSGFAFALANIARGAAVQGGAPINLGFFINISVGFLACSLISIYKRRSIYYLTRFSNKSLFYYVLSGAGILLGVVGLLRAYLYIPVWQALAIRNTQPVLVLLLSIIFVGWKEKVEVKMVAGIIVVTAGAILVNL